MLRLITYMVPSVPRAFYEHAAARLEARLGPTRLAVDSVRSGPLDGGPLRDGTVDLAFLCGASVLELADAALAVVPLVAAVAEGSAGPRYTSQVIVSREAAATGLGELRGARFAYNDAGSLSGVWSVATRLAELGADWSFFGAVAASGSHVASVERVVEGAADVAGIDSIVLARLRASEPALTERVRVIEGLGPYPAPPLVARSGLPAEIQAAVVDALCDPTWGAGLRSWGVSGFAPVGLADYEACRQALAPGWALGPPPG